MLSRVSTLFVLMALLTVGCVGAPGTASPDWIRRHGGLQEDTSRGRPRSLLARLATSGLPAGLNVQVLSSPDLAAYSWPDGSVFVTAGLLARLDDAELSAALSHELGHLLGERGGVSPPVGLVGPLADDREQRADAIGLKLMKQRHIPEEAMTSMLEKVVAAETTGSPCRDALLRRIEYLRRRSALSIDPQQ